LCFKRDKEGKKGRKGGLPTEVGPLYSKKRTKIKEGTEKKDL
jgi:hypothetical protein